MEIKSMKRLKMAIIFFVIMMTLLLCRLFYIQIICHEELENMAKSQYTVTINGISTDQYYYFILKEKCDKRLMSLVKLLDGQKVDDKTSTYYVFRTKYFDNIVNESLKKNYNAYVYKGDNENNGRNVHFFFWADAAGILIVGKEPEKAYEYSQNPIVQDVFSYKVTQKA